MLQSVVANFLLPTRKVANIRSSITWVAAALLAVADLSQCLRPNPVPFRDGQTQISHDDGRTDNGIALGEIITSPGQITTKRAACQPLKLGHGPRPCKDTAAAFLASRKIARLAIDAGIPDGYARTFANLYASSETLGYLSVSTLEHYDPMSCATLCTADDRCQTFNIFFLRAPTIVSQPCISCGVSVAHSSVLIVPPAGTRRSLPHVAEYNADSMRSVE